MPVQPVKDGLIDTFQSHCNSFVPDLIFLQIDPMPFMVRQRFMAQKCALHEVEDYDPKAM